MGNSVQISTAPFPRHKQTLQKTSVELSGNFLGIQNLQSTDNQLVNMLMENNQKWRVMSVHHLYKPYPYFAL